MLHTDPLVWNESLGKWTVHPGLYWNSQTDPDKLPIWISARGTNSVEAYHSRAHHLLSGSNNSTTHAQIIIMQVCGFPSGQGGGAGLWRL